LVYLIFEILWFLVAAAGLGVVVGWLCRSLAAPRRPRVVASRTRADHREEEARREQVDQLEARLAEAADGSKALQQELAQARQVVEAESLAARQREHELGSRLEAREAEVARLSAELETRRAQTAMPLPPHTVSSPLTPGPLEVDEPEAGTAPPPGQLEVAEIEAGAPPPGRPEVAEPAAGAPPPGLVAPQGAADDLRRINGLGQSIERALNENGIFHYRQIAVLTPANLVWLDRHLRLKGRIEREDWIGQAKALLAADEVTEGGVAEPSPLARQKQSRAQDSGGAGG
jgi:predicted flap endonuclease-1-like 5' DNA nuclease